jgi:small-conductance mechanosensitive channel
MFNKVLTLEFWQAFWRNTLDKAVGSGLKILLILLLYWVVRKTLFRLIDAALARMVARRSASASADHANRLLTLQSMVRSIVGYVLAFILIMMLLEALSVNITGIVTTAGVGGLAIGFGAQKLVRDVISGFFIITEDQFTVGEYVTIGPATGVVEEIGMRMTRIRDDQGRLWILSNGDISSVTNHSRAPVEAFIEVGIAPGMDVEQAQNIINRVGEELFHAEDHHLLAAPKSVGVSSFDAARTTLRVTIVSEPRTQTGEQLRVREAIRKRLLEENVTIA